MGEAAEMLLDGTVDPMGEYNYPGKEDEPTARSEAWQRNLKVRNLMLQKGIPKGRHQKRALVQYGKCFGTSRPTFHACQHWSAFKQFMTGFAEIVKKNKQEHK